MDRIGEYSATIYAHDRLRESAEIAITVRAVNPSSVSINQELNPLDPQEEFYTEASLIATEDGDFSYDFPHVLYDEAQEDIHDYEFEVVGLPDYLIESQKDELSEYNTTGIRLAPRK